MFLSEGSAKLRAFRCDRFEEKIQLTRTSPPWFENPLHLHCTESTLLLSANLVTNPYLHDAIPTSNNWYDRMQWLSRQHIAHFDSLSNVCWWNLQFKRHKHGTYLGNHCTGVGSHRDMEAPQVFFKAGPHTRAILLDKVDQNSLICIF